MKITNLSVSQPGRVQIRRRFHEKGGNAETARTILQPGANLWKARGDRLGALLPSVTHCHPYARTVVASAERKLK